MLLNELTKPLGPVADEDKIWPQLRKALRLGVELDGKVAYRRQPPRPLKMFFIASAGEAISWASAAASFHGYVMASAANLSHRRQPPSARHRPDAATAHAMRRYRSLKRVHFKLLWLPLQMFACGPVRGFPFV